MDPGLGYFLVVLWDWSEHEIAPRSLLLFIIEEHDITLFGPFGDCGV